jgi:antitoxin HigA-1
LYEAAGAADAGELWVLHARFAICSSQGWVAHQRSIPRLFRVERPRRVRGGSNGLSLNGGTNLELFYGRAVVSIKNEVQAGWAVHPGEILREEFLQPMGISPYRLAVELHVSAPTVNDIVREKRGITPEMAARLAKYFRTSEQFWLNLQNAFAIHEVKQKHSKELRAIKPLAVGVSSSQ